MLPTSSIGFLMEFGEGKLTFLAFEVVRRGDLCKLHGLGGSLCFVDTGSSSFVAKAALRLAIYPAIIE